ncbi:hypothetical protein EX30DRAFT_258254 [Ascodesmis nigricans]|uniref:BZIP domain-containing protein n=1 Tax=Ascodesmis nigricans TaxID=341454 RepID=A0A4S2MHE5_9PEZI|nr:hypothetical protein EX30DRAFT_258254 [Ascodesmis nigricans]
MIKTEIWDDEWALVSEFFPNGAEYSPQLGHEIASCATVSPSEVFPHAPVSTSEFTSPLSMFDSPSDGYETSPLFGAEDITAGGEWFSSPPTIDSPSTSPRFRSPSTSSKRSSMCGVRKRSQPLPPIVVEDPSDTVAMKRARNTLAARKSRAKKAEKMEDMARTIEQLEAQVEHWKNMYLLATGGQ